MSNTPIERLADRLDADAAQANRGPGGHLITVTGTLSAQHLDDGAVTWLELGGSHPAPALLRLEPADDTIAVGVSGTGWGHTMCESADLDSPSLDRDAIARSERIHHLVLADREGRLAGRVRWADGRTLTAPPDTGRIPDLLLRSFGLPTPPPTQRTIELFAAMWLNEVIGVSGEGARRLNWRRVELLHPAMRALQEAGAGHLSDVETAGRLLGDGWGWEELRQGVVEGRCWAPGLEPAEAARLDAGSFSRMALGWFPPLPELASAAGEALRPQVARRLRATLRAWGLPRAAGVAA